MGLKLDLQTPSLTPKGVSRSFARLDVRDGRGDRTVTITTSPFTIGRREMNALQLGGAEVSRQHAHIVIEGTRYILRDLDSRFGTYVNDARITEYVLRPGDRIRLGINGGAELVFDLGDVTGSLSTGLLSHPVSDVHQVAVLLETLRALGHARVLQEVLALVLDSAIALSGADRGFIMLASPEGRLEFKLARGNGKQTLDDATFRTSRKIPEAAFATGQMQVVRDLVEDDAAGEHPETREFGIRQVLCVPLHLVRLVEAADAHPDERRLGVLYLDGRKAGALLSETVRSGLETLAGEAAVAIQNARLYRAAVEKARIDQELHIAADIQRMLLPQAPIDKPCVEAAAVSLPCRSIGGDFFHYADQDEGRFAFTLGDVAGKGPPAALLSALLLGMFSLALVGNEAPASVVALVNGALCRRAIEGRFATLFHGVLDRSGCLRYCNAGHDAPVVLGRSGVRRLEAGGPVVGLFADAPYDQGVVQLLPGDRIVVFSDGVSEAVGHDGEEFGDDRVFALLETVLAASPDTSAENLLTALTDGVAGFSAGTPQYDDITAMVVRYRGPSAEAERREQVMG